MAGNDGSKAKWQRLSEQTLAETDPEKLVALVGAVEEALVSREQELAHSPDDSDERNAMAQATEELLAIKTEKLSWPRIVLK
jgi:hypothetical protein